MNRFLRGATIGCAGAAVLVCLGAAPALAGKPNPPAPNPGIRYTYVSLSTFGGTMSWAHAINNHGDVVGVARYPDETSGAFISNVAFPVLVDLNALIDGAVGWTVLTAYDVNDAGIVVAQGGYREDSDGDGVNDIVRSVLVRLIPTPEGRYALEELARSSARPSALNESGDVASYYPEADGFHAVLWSVEGVRTSLGKLGSDNSFARDVSDRDVDGNVWVTGYSGGTGTHRAWRTRLHPVAGIAEPLSDLGSLYPGVAAGEIVDSSGAVIGFTQSNRDYSTAARYAGGSWQSFGTLPGAEDSTPEGANNLGHVVGTAAVFGKRWSTTFPSFLYHESFGMAKLDSLVDNLPAGLYERLRVSDVNDSLVICGNSAGWQGSSTPDGVAYVLIPYNAAP